MDPPSLASALAKQIVIDKATADRLRIDILIRVHSWFVFVVFGFDGSTGLAVVLSSAERLGLYRGVQSMDYFTSIRGSLLFLCSLRLNRRGGCDADGSFAGVL
jgi:hypothetical protein